MQPQLGIPTPAAFHLLLLLLVRAGSFRNDGGVSDPDPFFLPPPDGLEPPRLNVLQVWITLLAPAAFALITNLLVRASGSSSDGYFQMLVLTAILAVCGWIYFGNLIFERYRGCSAVMLLFAYPLGQFVICLGVWGGSLYLLEYGVF